MFWPVFIHHLLVAISAAGLAVGMIYRRRSVNYKLLLVLSVLMLTATLAVGAADATIYQFAGWTWDCRRTLDFLFSAVAGGIIEAI